MSKTEFDLIVGIGEDCACSSYLRKNKLQFTSLPFDWLTRASFETRIQLLQDDFAHFLDIKDLRYLPQPTSSDVDYKHDFYENIRTNFNFYHDFPVGISLQESFAPIKEKYQRRIDRLYQK